MLCDHLKEEWESTEINLIVNCLTALNGKQNKKVITQGRHHLQTLFMDFEVLVVLRLLLSLCGFALRGDWGMLLMSTTSRFLFFFSRKILKEKK